MKNLARRHDPLSAPRCCHSDSFAQHETRVGKPETDDDGSHGNSTQLPFLFEESGGWEGCLFLFGNIWNIILIIVNMFMIIIIIIIIKGTRKLHWLGGEGWPSWINQQRNIFSVESVGCLSVPRFRTLCQQLKLQVRMFMVKTAVGREGVWVRKCVCFGENVVFFCFSVGKWKTNTKT